MTRPRWFRKEALPLWYRIQYHLMGNRITAYLIWWEQRFRKRYHTLRERRQERRHASHLRNFERKVCSQNGEDGILEEIFRRIGTTDRFFVEFGVQDGTECCTRNLLEHHGWRGVWIDGSAADVESAQRRFSGYPIAVLARFLTTENIVETFREAGVPAEFDLLSIDIDGNDYWIWQALGDQFRPRVVVIEYNATFGPRVRWIMPYEPEFRTNLTAYFGASLEAYAELADKLGYTLVGCESRGINAFFVRKDLSAPFLGAGEPASFHYVGPHYDSWFGHSVRPLDD